MELDELKKSWNALDEHLKDKKLVKDEEISQLINHATKNINEMSRLNKRLRIISLTIIALLNGKRVKIARPWMDSPET